jgi:hypothetical protein
LHFQLFLPDRKGADPAHLDAVGLETLRDGAIFLQCHGPGGRPGLLIAWTPAGHARIGFRPDAQEWKPAVPRDGLGAARYWIGIDHSEPPSPSDLKRPYQSPGPRVRLGDDREWVLPRAQELPRDFVLADDGTSRFAVQRRYHDFYVESIRWRDFFAAAQPGDHYENVELCEFVLAGLSVNYRMTIELAHLLKLFVVAGPSHPQSVARATFALLGFEEDA